MVEKEVEECMKYIIYRVQAREWDRKYRESDKGKKKREEDRKKNGKKWWRKYRESDKGKKKREEDQMYRLIKERCKNHYGLIGKTKYHIEGYGWVHPPINGNETWRWDGVTRKN